MAQHTLLLVDDEPMILSSLKRLLDDDYRILTADNGEQALSILASEPISVIISDQRMPRMLGHELLSKAKELSPNTIRILLTGYSDLTATVSSINSAEIFRYLHKPWHAEKLLETLKLACDLYEKLCMADSGSLIERKRSFSPDAQTSHLLIIDFNETRLNELKSNFIRLCQVHLASNAQEAFKQLSTWDFSALLIQELPDAEPDEVTFLTTVRMVYPNVISIVLAEKYSESLSEQLINHVGVFRYIAQPISMNEIKSAVELALARRELYKQSPDLNLRKLERDRIKSEVLTLTEEIAPTANMISRLKSWFSKR